MLVENITVLRLTLQSFLAQMTQLLIAAMIEATMNALAGVLQIMTV